MQRDFAEIAPGVFVTPCPPKWAPKVGLVKFMRVEANLYQPVIQAMPIMLMVGGPPMNTVVGMARLNTVGAKQARGPPFFLGRPGLGMPATWHASTGWAMCDMGSPSAVTVALPMKSSSS